MVSNELNNTTEKILNENIPELDTWEATEEQSFLTFNGDAVFAKFSIFGLNDGNKLSLFVVNKNHYKDRMNDICKVYNYFTTYFDKELKLFEATMQIKYIIDQKTSISIAAFRKMILNEIVTDEFIEKIKRMADRLYSINIDTDEEGKYKTTPKITNEQAKRIVAVSFAIRCILPICIHFSDTNTNFLTKTDYIGHFDKIIVKLIKKFESDGVKIYNPICKFVSYRVDRSYKADLGICIKKKQLYGTTKEIYLEEIIHEVILVKGLYKLDYNRSVVSFIDGVFFLYHQNYKRENFKVKPVEIESADIANDDDENVSHAEAIEMSNYHVDESNPLINEVNVDRTVKKIRKKLRVPLEEGEYEFYLNNVVLTSVTKFFMKAFYDKYFHDLYATEDLSPELTIELLLYMKKYLQIRGMIIIPQLASAKIKGKYKENTIKNSKFIEKITTLDSWKNIIQKRYSYISQLDPKEDPLIKQLSSFINSTFECVDFNPAINGFVYEEMDQDRLISEFSLFLTII